MTKKLHSLLAYIAFDKLIRQTELWIRDLDRELLGYSSEAICRRIIQRTVEIGCFPFTNYFLHTEEAIKDEVNNKSHIFSGLTIFKLSGELRLSIRLRLNLMYDFFKHWAYILFRATRSLIQRKKCKKGKATLLFGVGAESYSGGEHVTKNFSDFLKNGPITPLSLASRIIVRTNLVTLERIEYERISFDKLPLIRLLDDNSITIKQYIKFCCGHFLYGSVYLFKAIRFSEVTLLGRDISFQALVEHLNKSSLIENVVLTNSNFSSQQLWMMDYMARNYRTHMVWYAQNVRPVSFKADGVKSSFPHYRHLHCDTHWVWNDEFRDHLVSLGSKSQINPVGPILFYLPPTQLKIENRRDKKEVLLSVFDITPVKNEIRIRNGLGDYYCSRNMILFLSEIVEIKRLFKASINVNFKVMLKTKRAYHPNHDPDYISHLKHLEEEGVIELLSYDENLYDLISRSDVILTPPYSSPALIGSMLEVPSIFFDPTKEVEPLFEKIPNVFFASGRQELEDRLREVIV